MRRLRIAGVGVGLAAVLLTGVTAASGVSHTAMTVGGSATPAGAVATSGSNGNALTMVMNLGHEMDCPELDFAAEIDRGASVTIGNEIGRITQMASSTNCLFTNLSIPVDVTMSVARIVVRDHAASAGDPLPVGIDDANLHVEGPYGACEWWMSGSIDAILHPGTNGTAAPDGEIELVPADFSTGNGFDLDIQAGDGDGNPAASTCGDEVWTGDKAGPWRDWSTNAPSMFELDTDGGGDISHGWLASTRT